VKVVLDTNVVMSGIFFGGVPGRLLEAWTRGRIELVLSPAILEEYRRVGAELAAKYPARGEALAPVLALIAMHATMVDAAPLPERVSADPADDKFLGAAIATQASIVVSGDQDLLEVSGWRDIEVLTPRAFADRHLLAD
jgi:putative PIN family toxin of toxin-antitoxin system